VVLQLPLPLSCSWHVILLHGGFGTALHPFKWLLCICCCIPVPGLQQQQRNTGLCSMLHSMGCMRCIIGCMWHQCLYSKCLGFSSLSHLAVVAVAIQAHTLLVHPILSRGGWTVGLALAFSMFNGDGYGNVPGGGSFCSLENGAGLLVAFGCVCCHHVPAVFLPESFTAGLFGNCCSRLDQLCVG
jgi:hypothetical protein